MSTVLNAHPYTPPMDYSYSRHSNSSSAPLPRIPRWPSRSSLIVTTVSAPSSPPFSNSRTASAERPSPPVPVPVPAVLVVQPPTPPRAEEEETPAAAVASSSRSPDDGSSSSSGSESYVHMNPRTKRVRTPKMQPFRSPAESTPTPAVLMARQELEQQSGVAFPAQDSVEDLSGTETPRASSSRSSSLHINVDDLKTPEATSVHLTTVVRGENSRAVSAPNAVAANIARKKSGEPLKSSLKARRQAVRGNLSVVTGQAITKSEPATPLTSKSVHFDTRLEHVKLFLAEQKPLAISREGSPTDTSGTESDFPTAIYGPKRPDPEDRVLTMAVANMPPASAARANADVALEDIVLSDDRTALNGRLRVRNLAFEKWVAVRFTVDGWQTTSEVTAKYVDSLPGGVFDRFSFTIRLSDMLARLEERTLFFAVRYTTAGREIWDNNSGANYKLTFAKVARPRPALPTSTSDTGLATLKSKLESVVRGEETVGGYMAQSSSSSRRKKLGTPPTLDKTTSLSARYDFATSWKSAWSRSPPTSSTSTPTKHTRNVTYPHAHAPLPPRMGAGAGAKPMAFDDARATAVHHALTRGSPRIMDPFDNSPVERPAAASSSFYGELEDTPVAIMSRRRERGRNHQRGYFDLGLPNSPTVRLTPKTSPEREAGVGAGGSQKEQGQVGTGMGIWFAGSEDSTPSATSNSESSQNSSRASTPSSSPTEDGLAFAFGGVRSPAVDDTYSSFVNKYCYYTGASDSFMDMAPEALHRSYSASSVEEFLSSSPGPTYYLSPGEGPARSPSYDDVVSIGSGSSTPTSRSMVFGGSPQLLAAAH